MNPVMVSKEQQDIDDLVSLIAQRSQGSRVLGLLLRYCREQAYPGLAIQSKYVLDQVVRAAPDWFRVCVLALTLPPPSSPRLTDFQNLLLLATTRDPDPLARLDEGAACLSVLYRDENLPLLKCMLEAGLDVHAPRASNGGVSHFSQIANSRDSAVTVEWLLNNHNGIAHLSQVDDRGWTVLDWVCVNGYLNVSLILLRAGADPDRITPQYRKHGGRCPSEILRSRLASPADQAKLDEAIAAGCQARLEVSTPLSRSSSPLAPRL